MFMLNNLMRPILKDNPPPRIILLRLSPILFGLFVILPVAIFARNQQPPAISAGIRAATPPQAQEMLEPGQAGIGTLAPGERHGWSIEGVEGQRFAITLDADWDSHLALYMPDGIQTLTQDGYSAGNGRARIDGVTPPATGTYSIVVSGENGGAGAYQLRLTDAKPAQAPVLRTVGPAVQ